MSRLATLQAAKTRADLAKLLHYQLKSFAYIIHKLPPAEKYTTFEIPKRKGGLRTIHAPTPALRLLQRRLSDLLQDCAQEIVEAKKRKDRVAHGFKRKRSITTNARQHRNRRHVFNLDIENFFPSINFGRIRAFFIKNRDFALHEGVATLIAQIACHGDALPQGSPCSPAISNLVAHILDMRLVTLASAAGWTYSRYADDLTFSTNKKVISADIAERVTDPARPEAHIWQPGKKLRDVITRSGFTINDSKTRLMYQSSRQEVTGLVVNRQIGVRLEYRHNVRAMVHRLVKTGQFELLGTTLVNGQRTLQKRPGTLNELHGMLGFIDCIDVYNHPDDSEKGARRSARESVYREFLLYSIFYAAQRPTIVCEGETDNVYLTHAIRALHSDFPELAEVGKDKKIRLKVRLYKYPDTSTARILGLNTGGSGVLGTLLWTYLRETKHFTAPGQANPVMIVYDNDKGATSVTSAIKSITGHAPNGTEPFIRVDKNMYTVATPGADSAIEDFFEPAVRATVVDGKTFSPFDKADKSKHFGKKVFAHKVVSPNAGTINFDAFKPLLARIVAAMKQHQATHPVPPPAGAP